MCFPLDPASRQNHRGRHPAARGLQPCMLLAKSLVGRSSRRAGITTNPLIILHMSFRLLVSNYAVAQYLTSRQSLIFAAHGAWNPTSRGSLHGLSTDFGGSATQREGVAALCLMPGSLHSRDLPAKPMHPNKDSKNSATGIGYISQISSNPYQHPNRLLSG